MSARCPVRRSGPATARPTPRGTSACTSGKDGREITVRPTWEGGQLIGQVLQGVPNVLGAVLSKGSGDTGFNTMAHAVMKPEQGPWDKATWIPSGALFATKGQSQVSIDVSGASGRESDALAIAKIVMPRFEHPLDYDGAKAVALAPKPKAHPADACQFLPSSVVTAAIGPLQGTSRVRVPAARRAPTGRRPRRALARTRWNSCGRAAPRTTRCSRTGCRCSGA